MNISGKTTICGVIGDPIEHTMSPAMHNAAYRKLGIDYAYLPFRVHKDELGKAIMGMRALNIRGINVTIPHKVAVMQFLDEIDALAEKIGAVNTIVNEEGKLKGYNTDGTGFLRALLDKGVTPEGKKVVILGAGGAARAIAVTLADKGGSIVILNRREEFDWAAELAARVFRLCQSPVEALLLNDANLAKALADADILVNATSVGMVPEAGASLVPAPLLRRELVVFDAVYNPAETRLLADAAAAGATIIGGLDMLVWQGALAFELWTGQAAPVAVMKQAAASQLDGREK